MQSGAIWFLPLQPPKSDFQEAIWCGVSAEISKNLGCLKGYQLGWNSRSFQLLKAYETRSISLWRELLWITWMSCAQSVAGVDHILQMGRVFLHQVVDSSLPIFDGELTVKTRWIPAASWYFAMWHVPSSHCACGASVHESTWGVKTWNIFCQK